MWSKFKGYILGAVFGVGAITSIIVLSMTHMLEGIFVGCWLGTILGYLGATFIYEQHERNKKFQKHLIKDDKDILLDEADVDISEYEQECNINSNNHYAKNYIQRLTDKKTEEKIENRPRVVEACIIKTNEQEDNIEL